jgi:hypothetical protein
MGHRLMRRTYVDAPLGGEERRFQLTRGTIKELQETCNDSGIGAIFKRLGAGEFYADDIRETIRLGLVGGGMARAEAETLVKREVDGQPLGTSVLLASAILMAIHVGIETDESPKEQADAMTAETAPAGFEKTTAS